MDLKIEIFEMFEKANLNLPLLFIGFLLIAGLILIGSSALKINPTKLSERLVPLYSGGFLIIVAAFVAAFKGYIPW